MMLTGAPRKGVLGVFTELPFRSFRVPRVFELSSLAIAFAALGESLATANCLITERRHGLAFAALWDFDRGRR